MRYLTTKITRWEGLRNDWLNPMLKSIEKIGDKDLFETTYQKRSIKDDKLSHLGLAILQLSKLVLLEFIYHLEEHLVKGSYKICYLGK